MALQVGGVSNIGTMKYSLESRGTPKFYRQERYHKITNPQLFKENFKKSEKLVTGPDGGTISGQSDRLTVGRKITLTFFFSCKFTIYSTN
jgi:hypothetical protein